MTGKSFKTQDLSSGRSTRRLLEYKKVFLTLSLLPFGILIFKFAPRSLDFYNARSWTTEPKSLSYAEETKGHENEKSAMLPKPGVNPAILNQSAPGQSVTKSSKIPIGTRKALTTLSGHMRQQVEFLRDAIEEAHHQNLQLAVEPKCKGDVIQGEVEDMLCMPKPKFIKEVKNPCWWDPADNKTLRCIPYFHILGCEKCGSSDLWDRITLHPHAVRIAGIHSKEANWWGWGRYGRFHYNNVTVQPFTTSYTGHFLALANKVKKSLHDGDDDHKHLVTGDGTPSDLCDFRGWVNISQNRGLKLPQVLTPHLMKHIYPETTKFIVILRDPIERLYSDFCYASRGRSAEHFHTNLLGAIDVMANCIRKHSLLECFFSLQMYRRNVVRLHLILYTLHIREWLKVIPRERFMFLKNEEYAKDIVGTVKKCYEFLNFEPLDNASLRNIAKKAHALQGSRKKNAGPMWRSTKDILEEIVKPSMHFLPELLEDDRFMWDFKSTPVVEDQPEVPVGAWVT